ncbi:LPXTG cell wall anchor domain-containing protein [Streptomyces griseoaurantiacus]|uniref:LPXTG cell wall anchor domain-containing protein n=1 Tax=Streptomyces griseoaurantiacus TaxID=68213 RepID=UPI00346116D8
MRRTVLSALALACTAVLAGTMQPAFADSTPKPRTAATVAPKDDKQQDATPAPAEKRREEAARTGQVAEVPRGAADTGVTDDATPVPAQKQREEAARTGQVADVPRGAADTGVTGGSSSSDQSALIGGAAALVAAGGAGFLVVRRRRATGA